MRPFNSLTQPFYPSTSTIATPDTIINPSNSNQRSGMDLAKWPYTEDNVMDLLKSTELIYQEPWDKENV